MKLQNKNNLNTFTVLLTLFVAVALDMIFCLLVFFTVDRVTARIAHNYNNKLPHSHATKCTITRAMHTTQK